MKPTQQDEEVLASVQSIVDLMRDQGLLQVAHTAYLHTYSDYRMGMKVNLP